MVTEIELAEAEQRGREILASEPRAVSAHLDRQTGRLVVELMNGCQYAVPVLSIQDLQEARDEGLDRIEIDGMGLNLHWPDLDVDVYVPALVAGIFGTRNWMARELARVAGSAKSEAKSLAARRNGAKGGRPRKAAGA